MQNAKTTRSLACLITVIIAMFMFIGVTAYGADSDFPLVLNISGSIYEFATHGSSADGNWITLSGGTDITLPQISLIYSGASGANYSKTNEVGVVTDSSFIGDSVIYPHDTHQVFKAGRLVAEKGQISSGVIDGKKDKAENTFHLPTISAEHFRIKAAGSRAKVIETIPQQIITKKQIYKVKNENGLAVADPSRDILKIAVVERHKGTGNIGLGFVKGFGLKDGAIASSVAHDSHNIVVVGATDEDMAQAVHEVAAMHGGLIAVREGKVAASLPLPIGGLISNASIEEVCDGLEYLHQTIKEMGCTLDEPFMALSFLALPVIPELKITDKGLVDVTQFKIVPLFSDL